MATSSQTIPSAGATSRANRATGVPVERTPGPEKETGARAGIYSRDRLDSDTSSRASNARKNQTAGSTTSKSSSSTRRRQDSLKRAKEIAESNISQSPRRGAHGLRPAHLKTVDAFTGPWERQGNQFRVANVGMGGRIYLRPVTRPGVPTPNSSSLQSPTRAKPPALRVVSVSKLKEEKEQKEKERGKDEVHNEGDEERDDMSDSVNGHAKTVRTDFTGRESVWTKLSTAQDIHGAPSDIFRHRPRSRRSMSESTVNQVPLRAAALAQTKAFKVVIDRPDGNSASQPRQNAVAQTFNGLDISIPNFQMALPRLNDQDQSFIQGSTLTHTPGQSASPASAQFLESIPDGLPILLPLGSAPLQNARRPLPARRHSQASPYTQSISSFTFDPSAIPTSSTETYEPSHQPNITGHETISPAIYDILANAPNDPSVVRYSPQTGEMVAATPARLIVQITAETFLDYELLSDFFLTVRSYLSIHDLLSLLLARFEWAVNRFDDNGRIIRVRSFAAIRHWILNYFAYDFVPDRRLRLQFTRKLNYLFKLVQSRREYGAPDMKLISDLKKCWNGRCVLYWAGPVDNSLEADILPGGPGLEDDDDYDELDDAAIGSVTEASTDGMYSVPGSPPANYSSSVDRDSRQLGQQRYSHTGSGMTFQSDPMSPASEASASTGHKKQYQGGARRGPGSGSNEQKQQSARRHSEGSSDLPVGEGQINEPQQVVSYPLQTSAYRSVLRGHLLAPASPYVTTASASMGIPMVSPTLSPQTVDASSKRQAGPSVTGSGNPGMKQFIGNIKRALSSKVSSGSGLPYGEISVANGSPIYSNPPHRLDTSLRNNVPVEVLSQNVGGGLSGSNAIDTVRATMRIDLLAEQISMEFQKAIQGTNRQATRQEDRRAETGHSNQVGRALPTQHALTVRESSLLSPPEAKQVPSGMTSSSQSIVIFDDTGDSLAMPVVNEMPTGERTPRGSTFEAILLDGPQGIDSHAITLPRRLSTGDVEVSAQEIDSGASSRAATPTRLPSSKVGHYRQPSHSSVSLRRVASYQSALNRPSVDSFRQIPEGAAKIFDKASQKEGRMIPTSAVPARGLRRVPGGDLRANHNVADLEIQLTPRPRSTGSIATFASTRESEMLSFGDRITKTFKRDRTDRPLISPGFGTFDAPFKKAIEKDKEAERKKISLIRTQSDDRSARRPSFEAVVASFADIPDEDEGGPEATMLKLEGRYVKGAITAAKAAARREKEKEEEKEKERLKGQDRGKEGAKRISEKPGAPTGKRKPSTGGGDAVPGKQAVSRMTVGSFISEDSYDSVPLLERESAGSPKGKGKGQLATRSYVGLRPKSGSKRSTTDSFLLDAQEDESSDEYSDNSRRPSDTTINQDGPLDGDRRANGLVKPHATQFLSTSNPSPHRNFVEPHIGRTGGPTSQTHPAVHNPLALGIHPRHIPFVLGHDSKLICEQLTLIEKDALREIDWRDLVDMRWQQTASIVTNWVNYLVAGNPLGVDLVTARFNIMVKWVLSEITLTEAADERAMVIMKFIHIAREARRICNYATLLQLTIALTSTDCSRIKKTWDLVPQMDKDTLRDLEALVSPRGNFASLRSEMEDAPAELGCIPVLALYIHDLTYNAQKPPVVEVDLGMGGAGAEASNPNATRLLINFERYRKTAVIVKNLLRLIDASSKYNFVPVDDVLSHCMWIACLPDEVISAKSRAIEGSMANTSGQKSTIRH